MDLAQVCAVLDALEKADVPYWVGGGWGVDILAGRQTREHRDLDISIEASAEQRALDALDALGFVVETDWRPSRVEVAAPGAQWVDVHPVEFDDQGNGRQHDLDGGWFDYPAAAFTSAVIAGRRIPCLTVAQQVVFHSFYPPRQVDLHDLALLRTLDQATPADQEVAGCSPCSSSTITKSCAGE